jgi:hypothetical protein
VATASVLKIIGRGVPAPTRRRQANSGVSAPNMRFA